MKQLASKLPLVLALLLAAACQQPPAEVGTTAGVGTTPVSGQTDSADAAGDTTAHEGEALRPIMQRLAGDMVGFMYALWLEDYPAMAERAHALADHVDISPAEMRRIETALGPDMAGFEEADHRVHEASERLYEAAQARQLNTVLDQLNEVQRGCVACHTKFRDRLRTDQ